MLFILRVIEPRENNGHCWIQPRLRAGGFRRDSERLDSDAIDTLGFRRDSARSKDDSDEIRTSLDIILRGGFGSEICAVDSVEHS